MFFKREKINNFVVKPIKVHNPTLENIKRRHLIPYLKSTTYICRWKRSGKSNVIFSLMKECTDSRTKVVVFCPTHDLDNNWKEIKKWLNNNNEYEAAFFR